VDTNVILDVLLAREPFAQASAQVVGLVEQSSIEGFLCATTVTTLDYLLAQSLGRQEARKAVKRLLSVFEIALVNRPVLELALQSPMADFEDAVVAYSAKLVDAHAIVTRNTRDFAKSPLPALAPDELLAQLQSK